ncbi:hypothetical protein T01_7417 [Trichinella spiralis]|uniref:Uncharacterized protein n=1 Tax=Trichinella spiralis TaxID=6334 RepID=A0A0V1AKY7_TRISP|nr:hypothetical protein T01_7417 [Trichinella spiralis]
MTYRQPNPILNNSCRLHRQSQSSVNQFYTESEEDTELQDEHYNSSLHFITYYHS